MAIAQGKISAVELARRARVNNDDEALDELLDRLKPKSVTAVVEAVFPQGGLTPKSFDRLCNHFETWRDLRELSTLS